MRQIKNFENKRIVISGGGDSALDWAVNLAPISKNLTLVHRREDFRAAPDTVAKMYKLKNDGFALEKRQVNLPRGPIRVLGDDHIVTISLHSDVQVTIPVKLNVVQSDDNNPNAPENASTEEPSVQTEE